MREIGKAVLTMPVFTSKLDPMEVKLAMETVTDNQVKKWMNDNIGVSLFAKRLKFCNLRKDKMKIGKKIEPFLT